MSDAQTITGEAMNDKEPEPHAAFELWWDTNITVGHDGLLKTYCYKMRGRFTTELSKETFEDLWNRAFLAGQATAKVAQCPENFKDATVTIKLIAGGADDLKGVMTMADFFELYVQAAKVKLPDKEETNKEADNAGWRFSQNRKKDVSISVGFKFGAMYVLEQVRRLNNMDEG